MPRRPFGVYPIAILLLLNAVAAVWGLVEADIAIHVGQVPGFDIMALVLGAFGLAAAVGLLVGRRWGWVTAMIWAGLNMANGLLAYFIAEPPFAAMIFSVVAVFYLNQRDVQQAFLPRRQRAEEEPN